MRHLLFTCILALVSAPAFAGFDQSNPDAPLGGTLSEVKVGLLTHDSKMAQDDDHLYHIWEMRKEPGLDLNLEALFNGPDFLSYIGSPRIQLGTNLSLAGETSYIYSGLDWKYTFDSGFFLEGNFGLAVHNGTRNKSQLDENGAITADSSAEYRRTKRFGSRALFHFGPEVGYMFDEHNSLSVAWVHISNGEILSRSDNNANEGADHWGLRYGYKF